MLKKALDLVELALKYLCGFFMAAIVAFLFYAVVMRYVFHRPPAWTMELSRYMFLWMVILGAVLVTREQSHIQITFVVEHMPRLLRIAWLTLMRLAMIGVCWVMIHQGLAILPTVAEASSPTLGLSMGWLYMTIPVGGFLMAVFILETIIASIHEYRAAPGEREKSKC